MNVVKRSEYCKIGVSVIVETDYVSLTSIPVGTIFSGSIGPYPSHVWIMSPEKAVCLGKSGPNMKVGKLSTEGFDVVENYKVLNATLGIEGE